MVDVFRLADEFGAEQDNSNNLPKTRWSLAAENLRWSLVVSRLTPVKIFFRDRHYLPQKRNFPVPTVTKTLNLPYLLTFIGRYNRTVIKYCITHSSDGACEVLVEG